MTTTLRFLGLRNAVVTVTQHEPSPNYDADQAYTARCDGCHATLADDGGFMPPKTRARIGEARDWANEHAATCRALPSTTLRRDGECTDCGAEYDQAAGQWRETGEER